MANVAGAEGERLRRAALAGEPAAQRDWGKLLLSFQPPNYRDGLPFIRKAASAGDAEACYVAARYTAATTGDLGAGLADLKRAAELGYAPAQQEFALLSRGAEPDAGLLLTVPQARIRFAAPRIATIENFLSPEECDWLIARASARLEPARLYDPVAGYRHDPVRSNTAAHFSLAESDMVMVAVQNRIAAAAALPVDGLEAIAVLHYNVGQEFRPHFDFQNVKLYPDLVARLGQRVVTFLVYLNEDFDGGETHFPELDWSFKGRRGEALMFWNVALDGRGDEETRHAGMPPTRGEKWLLSQWIRDRNRSGLNRPWPVTAPSAG